MCNWKHVFFFLAAQRENVLQCGLVADKPASNKGRSAGAFWYGGYPVYVVEAAGPERSQANLLATSAIVHHGPVFCLS